MFGAPLLEPDPERVIEERQSMSDKPYTLDASSRAAVLGSVRNHCSHRGWSLLAAHVRSNHVHVVVEGEVSPEKMMNELKAYASRELNRLEGSNRKRWARHGSTRWLWTRESVTRAIHYVVEEQGEPMALFVAENR